MANMANAGIWKFKSIGNKYVIENKILGEGQFGIVYQGIMNNQDNTKTSIAVKVIEKKKILEKIQQNNQQELAKLKREAEVQLKFKHENILPLYDVLESANNFYYFLELATQGNLQDYLEKHLPYLSEQDATIFLKQIVDALSALESKQACHRDLKPANIMMFDNQLKIADFGFARFISEGETHLTQVGSPMYMSIDALTSPNYNGFKTDVWATGILFYQMLYGPKNFPWKATTIPSLIKTIQKEDFYIPKEPKRNPLVIDLLHNMLNKNEQQRFNWKQISEHQLFSAQLLYQIGSEDQQNFNLTASIHNINIQQKKKILQEVEVLPIVQEEDNTSVKESQLKTQNESNEKLVQENKNLQIIHQQVELILNKALVYQNIRQSFYSQINKDNQLINDQLLSYKFIYILLLKELNLLDKFQTTSPDQLICQHTKMDLNSVFKYLSSKLYNDLKSTKIEFFYNEVCKKRDELQQFLLNKLKNLGFQEKINGSNIEQYLQDCLLKIKSNIKSIAEYCLKNNKISSLQLFILIHLLINNESKLNSFSSIEEYSRYTEEYQYLDADELSQNLIQKWN